ncbi:polysaccharide deacetylase family protein [Brevibacillus sp. B_LB10_24]|uniref:polysaccharide deacetylase family protein n=1 Tax=Brevibacillus sp. B_LB10_24 TaxID=3380645 RepID=UPI0038BD10FC
MNWKNILLVAASLFACGWASTPAAAKSPPHTIFHVNTNQKLIALTFDDGPHPVYTMRLLKILDKYNAKGTFFVVGQRAKWYPKVIRKIHRKGHELGNHTYTHPPMRRVSARRLKQEIQQTDHIIHALTGTYPVFFRPPGGELTHTVLRESARQKHPIAIWSYAQDTQDWKNPGVSKIVTRVTGSAKPGNIVLFHDSGIDRTQTLQAVDRTLAILSKRGYKFVTLSELMRHHQQ